MTRYISSQTMFHQQDLSLWGEFNYLIQIKCIILEWDHIIDKW